MAGPTRYYVSRQTAAAVSVTPAAEWDNQTDYATGRATTAGGIDTLNPTFKSVVTDATATSNRDTIIFQIVTDPIAAGPISGTMKAQFLALEGGATHNLRSQIIARVVSNDGATVRGTLYAGDLATLTGDPVSEWSNTAYTNRAFPRGGATALTTVAAQTNDRVVIEVGYRKHAAISTNGGLYWGDRGTASDLPEDETNTGTTTVRPWVEFSDDLLTPREAHVRAWILE